MEHRSTYRWSAAPTAMECRSNGNGAPLHRLWRAAPSCRWNASPSSQWSALHRKWRKLHL
ncbi:hypothetical protein ACOSP7_028628 [Xanthoceras sorbifolium]